MTAQSELDQYFPSEDHVRADDTVDWNHEPDPDQVDEDDLDIESYTALLRVALDELMPGASAQKRKGIIKGAFTTDVMDVIFDKYSIEEARAKLKSFVENVEKKAGATVATKPEPAKAVAISNPPTITDPQPIAPVADLTNLAEAPFSATVKIWHKVYGVEVLLTVRSSTVSDGIRRLDTMMDKLLGEKGAYQAQRQQVDAPSTANRRISADNAPPQQSGPKPASAPVRSFDPDEGNKAGQVLHFESTHIEKVLTPKGKVEIRFYAPQPSGREPKYAELYVNLDSQLEEVYKHVDVEAMTLATRYDYPATIDYTLSKNKTQKGNPYKDLVAVHPKK